MAEVEAFDLPDPGPSHVLMAHHAHQVSGFLPGLLCHSVVAAFCEAHRHQKVSLLLVIPLFRWHGVVARGSEVDGCVSRV
jgi:hypothetical protein